MIKDIMDAIAIRLHEVFGDEYEINQEDIVQGLKEPCFLIILVDYSKEPLLQSRSKRLVPFDILFFPSNGVLQCYEVADQMMNELEFITLLDGDTMHATKIKTEVVEDVLHFFVNYNFVATVTEDAKDMMESIAVENGTKE
ncbi:phage tail terminator family protein [Amedibacterium intestinale]|uniref:phage tail terminator family protein n=1 Tax=Amedibacterium intestinale TaxID=2583452 RepID=UPI000E20C1A8